MASRRLGNWVAVYLAVGFMLTLVGCTGSEAAHPPSVSVEQTTFSTTTTTVAVTASTEPAPPEPDLADLEVLWGQLWEAAGLVPEERAPAIAELGDAIHPIVAEGVPTMLIETTGRKVSTFPVFNETRDGTIEIRDCIIYEPMIFESITHVHSGTAIPDGEGGWIIDSVTRETRGCVPAELRAEILEDYAEFWEARIEYTNPMDPDHPGIEATMTGEHLTTIQDRVIEAQIQGQYLVQGFKAFHPEITEVFSATKVDVLDCTEVGDEAGLFERDGERVGDAEPLKGGQRDLYTVSMIKEGEQWKVEQVAARTKSACDFAPTVAGLQVVTR